MGYKIIFVQLKNGNHQEIIITNNWQSRIRITIILRVGNFRKEQTNP